MLEPLCDLIMNLKSYPQPDAQIDKQIDKPQIVAHRGAWDKTILENTWTAFTRAQQLGAWAIELDIHFTSDDVPVVHHDPTLKRVFKDPAIIGQHTWTSLQRRTPELVSLNKVLQLKDLHFMIEVKTKLSPVQIANLSHELKNLTPSTHYHLLSLDPDKVFVNHAIPSLSWLLVGEFNLRRYADICLSMNLGGLAGHYVLMQNPLIEKLKNANKKVGVGFIPTKNLLNREWARRIDWVFTNSLSHLRGLD